MQRKVIYSKAGGLALTLVIIIASVSLWSHTAKTSSDAGTNIQAVASSTVETGINKETLAAQLGAAISTNNYPESYDFSINGASKRARVGYTIDEAAQAYMEKILNQYSPDYGAFVAIDAKTGRILSMVSKSRYGDTENLTLRATFPSASIFKVVTASAAIDTNKATPNLVVPFNGANHTLFRKNVSDTRVTKWTQHITMREAFARSVNTFFAKLGLFYVGPENLKMYAERYFFNRAIHADVPVQIGYSKFNAEDPWSIVTAASGFTRENTMSPLQGALIAATVANDGVMMEPFLVDSLTDESGEKIYKGKVAQASVVVEPRTADELRELFQQTVRSGTSRKAFRKTVGRVAYEDVEFGGKTGSLTGLNPAGKCDWFIGYARFGNQRIAVGALTVNEKKWKVKSSTLANLFFTEYLKGQKAHDVAKNQ